MTYYLLCLCFSVFAVIPNGYYNLTNGKNKGDLKTALHTIIGSATVLNYGSGAGATWSAFPLTDACADGTVWDMYSNQIYQFNGTNSVSGMNIEHSLPKSWWGGTVNQAYKDLHHLNPSDATANNQKSNWTMGVVDGEVLFDNGVIKRGRSFLRDPLNSIIVWEPADEYKGDFARIYMYMVTCYEQFSPNDVWNSDASMQLNVNNHATYPLFQDWTISMLLAWHRADPVSVKELNRNEVVYTIQGNRNPFIDCPLLAEYVWGMHKEEAFSTNLIDRAPYISTPIAGTSVACSAAAYGQQKTVVIPFRGYNLTQPITLALRGASASKFTLSTSTLQSANMAAGCSLNVLYRSLVMASDTVELLCYSAELTDTLSVLITASTDDSFQLLDPLVGMNEFTIRWNASVDATNYKISVYELMDVGHKSWVSKIDEDFLSTPNLPVGWSSSGYLVSNQLSEIRLSSASQAGVMYSPAFVLSDSVRIQVRAKYYDSGSKLTISSGSSNLSVFTLSAAYQEFQCLVSSSDLQSGIFAFSAAAGKRIVIDRIRIESYESVETPVLLPNYPKIESCCSHVVTGLTTGSVFYYTVQPQGGVNEQLYGPLSVVTGYTSVSPIEQTPVVWRMTDRAVIIEQLDPASSVWLCDSVGRVLFYAAKVGTTSLQIPINKSQELLILRVNHGKPIKIARH